VSIRIAGGFAVTEPIRQGYASYRSAAAALCDFCDEVVIVCGRYEAESEKILRDISPKIKVVNTSAWPVDYDYDDMRDHFQAIFDNTDAEICLKIDSDCVFSIDSGRRLRAILLKNKDIDVFYLGRINYWFGNIFTTTYNRVLYAINRQNLSDRQITYRIDNETGMNIPKFSGEVVENQLTDQRLFPINYNCTFMNRTQILAKHRAWVKARNKLLLRLERHNQIDQTYQYSDRKMLLWFRRYHEKKLAAAYRNLEAKHPDNMTNLVKNLASDQWGFSNFRASNSLARACVVAASHLRMSINYSRLKSR